jgi:hypothetical protein
MSEPFVDNRTGPTPVDARDRASGGRVLWIAAVVALFALHVWLSLRLFPSFGAVCDNEPVISVDHAIHLYHGSLGARFLKEHGTSWGYDPFFMAGYPKTPVYDSSSGPSELFQLLAGGTYSPRAYKVGLLILVLLAPVAVMTGARAFGMDWPATCATGAWVLWYWWVGFPDTLVRTGLAAFVWSSAIAVLATALFAQWRRRPRPIVWCLLTLAVAVGIQAHNIFPLMVLVPLAVGYVLAILARARAAAGGNARSIVRWHAATWLSLIVALAATHFWWWPLLQFLPLKTGSDLFMKAEYWGFALEYYLLRDGRVPFLVVAFGVVGLCRWYASERRLEVAMLASQLALLSLLTFAGSMWRVTRELEPLRFQVPLHLAWCIPAGEGLGALITTLDPRVIIASRRKMFRAIVVALCAIGGLTLVSSPMLWWRRVGGPTDQRPLSTWQHTKQYALTARPLAVGLRPEMNELVDWLNANTNSSARILFEDQLRLLERGDPGAAESLHWTPLLPLLTGRQFVGGLYHLAFIPHQYAAFGDWQLAGQHIRLWSRSPQRLAAFCEQYNIGWVVTWSRSSPFRGEEERRNPLATDVFDRLPFCERVATLPRHTSRADENEYAVFRVLREPSYFARGRGRIVHADYNRIELADLEPAGEELVLRYHWQPGLRADPPIAIERADVGDDPIGFIRIKLDRATSRLTLENGYR